MQHGPLVCHTSDMYIAEMRTEADGNSRLGTGIKKTEAELNRLMSCTYRMHWKRMDTRLSSIQMYLPFEGIRTTVGKISL